MRLLLNAAVIFGLLAASACTLPPLGSERMEFISRDYGFVDRLRDKSEGSDREVYGWLMLPEDEGAGPPYPAVVMLHSSIGQGTQDWYYADVFRDMGFAVLAVDSFFPRGVSKTVKDLTLVTETSMMADAYGALNRLSGDPRIDPERIGLVGFSKGGIAALYSAFATSRRTLAAADYGFAAHVAYYPWCGVEFYDLETTGAPVLIEAGAEDKVAPPELCRDLAEKIAAADPKARITLSAQPEALHAFDHPLLSAFDDLPVSASLPTECRFREVEPNLFVEETSGRVATEESLADIFKTCSRDDARAGGNEVAAQRALEETKAFLRRHLLSEGR
jgi:dienelactone hydrolase